MTDAATIISGDVVEHTSTRRHACVVRVGPTCPDGTAWYRVRPARDPDLGVDLAWWSSAHVRRARRWPGPGRADPYRRYLALVAVEDDAARRARRQRPEDGERRRDEARGGWRRRSRTYGPWLPEAVWDKMYWRLCNQRRHDAGGQYVHYSLGREHWEQAAIACLERRDRAARWWMEPRVDEVVP